MKVPEATSRRYGSVHAVVNGENNLEESEGVLLQHAELISSTYNESETHLNTSANEYDFSSEEESEEMLVENEIDFNFENMSENERDRSDSSLDERNVENMSDSSSSLEEYDFENLSGDDVIYNTVDDYDSDENYADVSNDNSAKYIQRIPLYKNSTISMNDAVIKIMDLWIDQKLSKTYLEKHLEMMQEILPKGNSLPKTKYKLFKYIKSQVPTVPIINHYFCEDCLIYLSTNYQCCSQCGGANISHFYELDFMEQIKQLFEKQNLSKKLQLVPENEEFIQDLTDGCEYKRVNNRAEKGPFDLTLIFYTDGLSLVKSAASHCWPLMFVIAELPPSIRYSYIVTFGLWCSNKLKPPMNLFLQPFCTKVQECFNVGVEWVDSLSGEKHTSKIIVPLFIADAPARAQIQNILNFNGKYGCNICEIKTTRCKRTGGKKTVRVYPYKRQLYLRTKYRMKIQAEECNVELMRGVKGHTIISILPKIDISKCIIPEYMHSVLLGVVKQFINIWVNKNGPWKLTKHMKEINNYIKRIKPLKQFKRNPRALNNFQNFKATEFYNFLLFYSIPLLSNYLPQIYLEHWMLLVVSIYNLLKEKINIVSDLEVSEQLLSEFVSNIKVLYGEQELSYNIHQLLHLCLSVKRWGPLWANSAFMFENQNGLLAKSVHGKHNLGKELLNNLQIIQATRVLKCLSQNLNIVQKDNILMLGKNILYRLNDVEKSIFLAQNIDVERVKFFLRAEINNLLFTSSLYKDVKFNNYTVMINSHGYQYYGSIKFFFTKDKTFFFYLINSILIMTNILLILKQK